MDALVTILVLQVMPADELEETTVVDPPAYMAPEQPAGAPPLRARRDTLPYYFPPRRIILTTSTWGDS